MKAPSNIKNMSANEIMEKFCPKGEPVEGVKLDQNYNLEITIIKFDDCEVNIHNNTIMIVK